MAQFCSWSTLSLGVPVAAETKWWRETALETGCLARGYHWHTGVHTEAGRLDDARLREKTPSGDFESMFTLSRPQVCSLQLVSVWHRKSCRLKAFEAWRYWLACWRHRRINDNTDNTCVLILILWHILMMLTLAGRVTSTRCVCKPAMLVVMVPVEVGPQIWQRPSKLRPPGPTILPRSVHLN